LNTDAILSDTNQVVFELARLVGAGVVGGLIGSYAAHWLMRPYTAVIRVFDAAGNVIETHEHAGDLREW
jgi:hypothetical protein